MSPHISFMLHVAIALIAALALIATNRKMPAWAAIGLIGLALYALAGMALAMSEAFPA